MDLRLSSVRPRLSPSDSISNPEEKEISDDDDDRNHKHRRRETQSHSFDKGALEQVITRPYLKRNKPFENGNSYKEASSQSNETWRNYNMSSREKDYSGKFDRKRVGLAPISRAPLDLNQRHMLNNYFPGDPGFGRARGREPGSWSQRDSRFNSADVTLQMAQQGPVPSSLFGGRGISNVSNAQTAPWNAFGLVPGLTNGGMDTLQSLGLRRTFGAPINPSMGIGISHQRCRDFEELGFCIRGDMCPMEHGVNRIIVEDVQSLSQFNLPVSLPSAHLLGSPTGPGPLSAVSSTSNAVINNNKGLYSKSIKSGVGEDGLGLDGTLIGSAVASGADFYDPDQPLWSNDCSQTSTAPLVSNSAKVNENESSFDADAYVDQNNGLFDGSDNEGLVRGSGIVGSQSTSLSMQAQIGGSKNKSEKIDSKINYATKEDHDVLNTSPQVFASHQGRLNDTDDIGPKLNDSLQKNQNDGARNFRKPSQKAQRTLFVNGIPQKNNRRDALLSHFKKFGEVIDIYIPLNSERAFVQFSKREEAEDALKAPDAVMGNRFIKLWWANRDNIPDEGVNSVAIPSPLVRVSSTPAFLAVANRGKGALLSTAPRGSISQASVSPALSYDPQKPVVINGQFLASQKKIETLEFLKEEIRKKQEMPDQKRHDFKCKLDKLEKQATGLKGEVAVEQAAKKQYLGTVADVENAATQVPVDPIVVVASPVAEMMTGRGRSVENVVPQSLKTCMIVASQEPSSSKKSIHPLAPAGAPFVVNRFKLDNRPSSFTIVPPLPSGLANVAALKEHFSTYGELLSVDFEDLVLQDGSDELVPSTSSARICFSTRHSAERAFLQGKCWKGENMQFMWLTPCSSTKDHVGRENPSSNSSKWSSDATCQAIGEGASAVSHKTAMSGDGESEVSVERDGAEPILESHLHNMPSKKHSDTQPLLSRSS